MVGDPNIEFLQRAFGEWSSGDFSSPRMFADDVEFVTDMPERRTHRGHEGVVTAWSDWMSAWQDFTVTEEEIIELDDGRYLVLVRLRGRGLESGLPIEQAGANIVEVADGKIARFELYFERDRGLTAAGVKLEG